MAEKVGPYAAFGIRDFRQFILARQCATLAIHIQATIVGWQLYDITHDPLALGLIGLTEAVPAITVSLYAGHIADVVPRKNIILTTISVLFLCASSLLFFTLKPGAFILAFGAFPIYIVIFISGLARGFLSPANFSFMPQLIPRHLYANAISLNTTFWLIASIVGPMLAGFIYALLGISATYFADVILLVGALLFYFSIPGRPVPPASDEQGVRQKIKSGLKFVMKTQVILGAISLDMFAVLFGGAVALLPIFAAEILKVGPQGLGMLRSAPAIGAVVMAFYVTHNPIRRNAGKVMLVCVAGFGASMIGFGLSTSFIFSLLMLMLSGMFDSISMIIRSTLIHTRTPENMKGRVSAVNSIFVGSSNEIGAFESGATAKLMGAVASVVFGGFMTLVVVGVTGWKAKKLRNLDQLEGDH
ncbi:MAG: MFS transporter [Cyclobacteriaceae bacterium]|nr:MFS transporter [Cyclobacteriaceae bacterium]